MKECGHESLIKTALQVFEFTRPLLNSFLVEHFGPGKYRYRPICQPMFQESSTVLCDREDYRIAATIVKHMGSGEGLVIGVIEEDVILYTDPESGCEYSHEVYASILAEDTHRRIKLWVPFPGSDDREAEILEIGDLKSFVPPDDYAYLEASDQLVQDYPETSDDFLEESED